MAWQKGQSGNPGGRAKKTEELSIKIREMDEVYRQRMHEIVMKGSERDAIQALKLLWGYGHGLPTQRLAGEDGGPVQLGIIVLPASEPD